MVLSGIGIVYTVLANAIGTVILWRWAKRKKMKSIPWQKLVVIFVVSLCITATMMELLARSCLNTIHEAGSAMGATLLTSLDNIMRSITHGL